MVTATAVVAVTTTLAACSGLAVRSGQGGLRSNTPEAPAGVMVVRSVGQQFCYGMIALSNPSSTPATLESLTPLDGSGLAVGDPVVLGQQRQQMLMGADDACPPGGVPLKGYVLDAGTVPARGADWGDEVLVPLTITHPGRQEIAGFRVRYRQGGRTYQLVHRIKVVACTRQELCAPPVR